MIPRVGSGVRPSVSALGPALLALVLLGGCGGSSTSGEGARRPLSSYSGSATQLFDDAIEQRAVGLDLDNAARLDPQIKERSQASDAVLRVRVDTVTARDDGASVRYDLGLRTLEKITGEHPPPSEFNVRVDKESPAFGIVRGFQARLSGKVFIVFVREFVRPDGDTDIHFHMAADDKEIARAVRDANVLSELK